MDNSTYNQPNGPRGSQTKANLGEAASHLYEEGKKAASEFYEANAEKVSHAQEAIQDTIKEYSNELTSKVKTNPLSALVIAGGIGFILAKILSK